jgi:hypothetical protein
LRKEFIIVVVVYEDTDSLVERKNLYEETWNHMNTRKEETIVEKEVY